MINRRKLLSGLMISTIIPLSSVNEVRAQKAVGKNENGEPRHNISSYRHQKWQNHFTNKLQKKVLVIYLLAN